MVGSSKITVGLAVMLAFGQWAMCQDSAASAGSSTSSTRLSSITDAVFAYLSMAGSQTSAEFRPLSQSERNRIFGESLINPIWYLKGAVSGGFDLAKDKPAEWEQGASGYAKRVGNIMGQYAVQRSSTFGLSSLLHEDNRYFGSGKKGFWSRTGYAVYSSIMARHDNGKQYPSISLVGGFAAGAFVSRWWQPPSTRSAGDGAVSFGLSMGFNVFTCGVKEFLPDIVRPLTKGRRPADARTKSKTIH